MSPLPADRVRSGALVLTFFEDERPLRGASGLIDWRMDGFVSRLLEERRLEGHTDEATLIPSQGRVGPKAILLIGLGKKTSFNYRRITETATFAIEKLHGIDVNDFAFEIPGRHVLDLNLERGSYALTRGILRALEVQAASETPLEVLLLDRHESFRAVTSGIARARSQFSRKIKIAVVQG
ncbi:MAG: M17 family peptidase N-terminal domain-containing protein [Vicinamibacteria bacterium]